MRTEVICTIFAIEKGIQGPLRWSAFTKVSEQHACVRDTNDICALEKHRFKGETAGQNETDKGSARVFICTAGQGTAVVRA